MSERQDEKELQNEKGLKISERQNKKEFKTSERQDICLLKRRNHGMTATPFKSADADPQQTTKQNQTKGKRDKESDGKNNKELKARRQRQRWRK